MGPRDGRRSELPAGWRWDRIAALVEETDCDHCGMPLEQGDPCARSSDDARAACGRSCAHQVAARDAAEREGLR
jgi:hypothetical protein